MCPHHVWLCRQERQISHCGKDTLISPDLRRFRVRPGRKGNNHSRHLGNLLLGASGRQATVQTAPAPTPPTPRALLSCCPPPQASPKAPRRAPLRGWEGHPTPFHWKGLPSTPTARDTFPTCNSDHLFSWNLSMALLSALRTKAQVHSTAPQTLPGPPQPHLPETSSAMCPPLSVPATLALTPSFLSCPFAPSLLSNHLQGSAPKVISSGKPYLAL